MALNKTEGAHTVFLSVADGNLVRQHKTPTKDTSERVTKTGKLVYEERFKDLTGTIIGLETKENDYGKQWCIAFKDGEDKYVVNLSYSSRYASSFLKALPNVRKGELVKFMPWSMVDKQDASKKVTGITMYQNDGNGFVKVAPAFTKEEPNGIPQMVQKKVKGKLTWDDSDMMEFLEESAMAWLGSSSIVAETPTSDEAPF